MPPTPFCLFPLPHLGSVSLAFNGVTEPNTDPACEVRTFPANHLASTPLNPHHTRSLFHSHLHANATLASNLTQACICLHADELVSKILNANIAIAKGLMCILNANDILNWNTYW